jgi:heavy metal translocating P-type ATPase
VRLIPAVTVVATLRSRQRFVAGARFAVQSQTAAAAEVPSVFSVLADVSKVASLIYAAIAAAGLVLGGLLWLAGVPDWPDRIWFVATLPALIALAVQMVGSLRRGDFGLDAIALLSMTAALAFGETLAANVVALMYAGGQLLEDYAAHRAERSMTALVGRVAAMAMRFADGRLVETPIGDIAPGDRLLIRHGEVLPVDGRVATAEAVVDQSALTGESMPVRVSTGGEALSGSTSVGPAFELVTTRQASESTYARIVALVQAAREQKPPAQRLADRYALGFLVVTLALAGGAFLLSGDPIRALAVLVVATPCPLILAVPVAMISGLSRAATRGVLIKGGGALERLAGIRSIVFDKTGTVTHGEASLRTVTRLGSMPDDEVLRLAASLDQASGHVLAAALIAAARARGLTLSVPVDVSESAGAGVIGTVEGRRVALGGRGYVAAAFGLDRAAMPATPGDKGATHVWVAVDGVLVGILHFEDRLRSDAAPILKALRQEGIARIVLASGDRSEAVDEAAAAVGVDAAFSELTPAAKVDIVRAEAQRAPVMMVGDGVNDAPALAAATIGLALGARGEAAASEAADVVLLVDRLEPVLDAVRIAHRTRRIALQSVLVGIGLSFAGMVAAALGYLPPVIGAFMQEAIDIAVILNALRALR